MIDSNQKNSGNKINSHPPINVAITENNRTIKVGLWGDFISEENQQILERLADSAEELGYVYPRNNDEENCTITLIIDPNEKGFGLVRILEEAIKAYKIGTRKALSRKPTRRPDRFLGFWQGGTAEERDEIRGDLERLYQHLLKVHRIPMEDILTHKKGTRAIATIKATFAQILTGKYKLGASAIGQIMDLKHSSILAGLKHFNSIDQVNYEDVVNAFEKIMPEYGKLTK